MSKVPEKRRAEPLFPLVGFRDTDGQPPAPLLPPRVRRGLQRLRSAWRPWWTSVVVAVVVAAAVVTPLPMLVVSSTDVVQASTLVRVEVAPQAEAPGGHTGAYLTPTTERATIATAAVGLLHPDRHLTGIPAASIQGYDPIDTALMSGAGMAPYLGSAAQFGLRATFPRSRPGDVQGLALLLEIHDQVSALDLAAGRTILVLATVRPDGATVCTPGSQRTVTSTRDVDVIVAAPDCADDLQPGDAELVEVPTFHDALVALGEAR